MNTEDEVNYKGHAIQLIGVPTVMPNHWRAFTNKGFLCDGDTRDEAIRNAQKTISQQTKRRRERTR